MGIDSALCIWPVAWCQLHGPLEIRSLNHDVLAFPVYFQGVNGLLVYEHKTFCRCASPAFRGLAGIILLLCGLREQRRVCASRGSGEQGLSGTTF